MAWVTRPEIELLLAAGRSQLDDRHTSLLADLVAGDIDWEWTLGHAVEHGLVPLLHRSLTALPATAQPGELAAGIAAEAKADAGRTLLLTSELLRVLDLFAGAGVVVVPYKGPVVAAIAYGSVTARSYGDLDLVVAADDLDRAARVLTDAGYEPLESEAERARARAHRFHHVYVRPDRALVVELHWAFTYRSWRAGRDMAPLLARTETVVVAGQEVPTFSREDLVVLLAVHGAKHYWERLLWIADIAELTRPAVGIDWDVAVARATATGTLRMVLIGAYLARDLFDARLPRPVAAALASDPVAVRLAARLRDLLLGGTTPHLTGLEGTRFYLAMRERRREKLPYLFFPNEEDLASVDLPAALAPLYYVVRPVKLLTKYTTRRRPTEETT